MRARDSLLGCLAGVIITAAIAVFALHQNDNRWRQAAWDHHAAVYYTTSATDSDWKWAWADDFFTEIYPRLHPELTPKPARPAAPMIKIFYSGPAPAPGYPAPPSDPDPNESPAV